MNRRDFLKVGGLLTAALAVQASSLNNARSAPVEVSAQEKIYQGASGGRILVSADAGQTWKLHSAFGSEFRIVGLSTDRSERLRVALGYRGHAFALTLDPDGARWQTT